MNNYINRVLYLAGIVFILSFCKTVAQAQPSIPSKNYILQNNEDLYITSDSTLQFKDRLPSDKALGYKYLRRQGNINTQFNSENTIYEIRYKYDLQGKTLVLPVGTTLKFVGGSIVNGTLLGNNTTIEAQPYQIFDTKLSGTWSSNSFYTEWFGAKGDGITDDTSAFKKTIESFATSSGVIRLLTKTYCITSIDLTGFSNISIEGENNADILQYRGSAILKVINDIEYAIRTVGPYKRGFELPSKFGKSILIKNLFIDCNNKAKFGINCKREISIENVLVRFAKEDGIVLESGSYPVYLKHVKVTSCGGNGISILAPYTTCYTFSEVECGSNNGYGLYIEDGNTCVLTSVLLQANKRGGIKINQIDYKSKGWIYKPFLSRLTFIGLYTEGNGMLSKGDKMYDGNYAVYIKGINESPVTNANKIDDLTFIGCSLNFPSATSSGSHIVGTRGLANIGCSFLSEYIDKLKNSIISL